MVEISECQVQDDVHAIKPQFDGKIGKDFETSSDSERMTKSDKLPEPDLVLVAEVRQLVKAEWDKDPEESEKLYSKYHYEEILDSAYTCWRYLLHMHLDVKAATQLIKATLKWRKENRVDELQAKDFIKDIWLRCPIGFTGKTKDGLDLVYAIGKNYRKTDPLIKQMVRDYIGYQLFEWDRKHRYDLERLVIVFDISDTGFRNMDLDFTAWMVTIVDYIPSRIEAIYGIGIPYILRPLVRLIISWLPERYKRITHCGSFDELVAQNVSLENLPVEVGGLAPDTWRLAPPEATWAAELESEDSEKIFAKICDAISFNTKQEKLDQLYAMQREFEAKKM